jgi:deoxyribonuclease V
MLYLSGLQSASYFVILLYAGNRQMREHRWDISISDAIRLQKDISGEIISKGRPKRINTVAGVDLSYEKLSSTGFCSIVVLTFPSMERIKIISGHDKVIFPYVPGLLSFREGPLFLKTFGKLKEKPDLIIFDGQGIAHPRKLGLASHMGYILGLPSIGCAKSRLYGIYDEPGPKKGDKSYLYGAEKMMIGTVLRTKDNIKPLFISPGHLVGIDEAADIIMQCVRGFRVPEPTRLADIEVALYKKSILNE